MRLRTEFPAVDLVVRQYDSHILVYTLSDAENINRLPTIRFGLRILEDMYMKLLINGILIHTNQLAWAIITSIHWYQRSCVSKRVRVLLQRY